VYSELEKKTEHNRTQSNLKNEIFK